MLWGGGTFGSKLYLVRLVAHRATHRHGKLSHDDGQFEGIVVVLNLAPEVVKRRRVDMDREVVGARVLWNETEPLLAGQTSAVASPTLSQSMLPATAGETRFFPSVRSFASSAHARAAFAGVVGTATSGSMWSAASARYQ